MKPQREETLIGLNPNSYRWYRRWEVDSLEYAHTLPPDAKAWLERFLREDYDADTGLLNPEKHARKCAKCRDGKPCNKRREGPPIHRDEVEVKAEHLPPRWRRWWGKQLELWPVLCADWLNARAGMQVAQWKDRRRECFRRQNYAYDDVYSRGAVTLWEDFDRVDTDGNVAPPSEEMTSG